MPSDYEPGDCPRAMDGDILISRANTRELVGAPVMVRGDHPRLLLSDKLLKLVADEAVVDRRYLVRALRSSAAVSHFSQRAGGSSGSMKNVTRLPWFSAKDMKAGDLFDSEDHIAHNVPSNSSLKLLPANTVSIVVRGMILAHTFPVCVLRVPATINQDLKALLPLEPLEAQFLANCLRAQSAYVLGLVSEAGHGTKRLDSEALSQVRVLCPPIEKQREFVARVNAIESLQAAHRASLAHLDSLFASLQHRAFRGEL